MGVRAIIDFEARREAYRKSAETIRSTGDITTQLEAHRATFEAAGTGVQMIDPERIAQIRHAGAMSKSGINGRDATARHDATLLTPTQQEDHRKALFENQLGETQRTQEAIQRQLDFPIGAPTPIPS